MKPRTAVASIVAVTFVLWMGSRATAIALPLVALDQTGDVGTTGLVLGAHSVPLVTVGWWGSRLRERITGGRAVAVVMGIKLLGLALVPVAAALHCLSVGALVACGLVVGATSALDAPAVRSLLCDLGDALGPGEAARALTWQDLAHRCTMFLAPPLGALAVGQGHTMTLLWSECVAVGCGALLMASLPGTRQPSSASITPTGQRDAPQSSISAILRKYPRMTASIGVHAIVSLTWFAFSLGLAITGAQTNRPGELIAAGMVGYGLASTATSFVAPALVNRIPAWPTAILPAAVLGGVFIAMPTHLGSLTGITLLAAVGGATMPLGIAAHNQMLATAPDSGTERRAAFVADQIADGGASAIGMLVGGAIIATIGASNTLIAAGALQITAVLLALARRDAVAADA